MIVFSIFGWTRVLEYRLIMSNTPILSQDLESLFSLFIFFLCDLCLVDHKQGMEKFPTQRGANVLSNLLKFLNQKKKKSNSNDSKTTTF